MVLQNLPSHVPPASKGSYPVRAGNLVRPLIDGIPAFRRIAEVVDAAEKSVWLTVAFYAPDFRFPNGGTLFDVLDSAVERGLEVRVLFWRPNEESAGMGRTFSGTQIDRDFLRDRHSRLSARWDRAYAGYVQHQKSWIIDAGYASETAFVGGINPTAKAMGSPGHRDGGRHDLYVEIAGPSASDVHHNFVQRWNEASERDLDDGIWGPDGGICLPFPTLSSSCRGASSVQIQRMVRRETFSDNHPAVDFQPYHIAQGEQSILEQYERAIDAAQSTIIIENQALPVPAISCKLDAALKRGVKVVVTVPAEPEAWVRRRRQDPKHSELFERVEALESHDDFTLAGLVTKHRGAARFVYVHAKTMLVDDAWATIGSCNLHSNSLSGHLELNASIWDDDIVRNLRCMLFEEHLGRDTSEMDAATALRLFQKTADRNRSHLDNEKFCFKGLVVRLRATEYGL